MTKTIANMPLEGSYNIITKKFLTYFVMSKRKIMNVKKKFNLTFIPSSKLFFVLCSKS